jgi:hypothetical protein
MEPRSDGRIHNRFSYLLGNFLEAKENAEPIEKESKQAFELLVEMIQVVPTAKNSTRGECSCYITLARADLI